MATLFSDDFEANNLNAWTGTNGVADTSTASVLNGTYGCELNSSDAFVFKDFTEPASLIVTHGVHVKLVTASGSGTFRVLQISQSVGGASIVRLRYNNGNFDLWMNNKDGTVQTASLPTLSTNTWYYL